MKPNYILIIPLLFFIGCAGSCEPEKVTKLTTQSVDLTECKTPTGDYLFQPRQQTSTLTLTVTFPDQQTTRQLMYRQEQGSTDFFLVLAPEDFIKDVEPARNSSATFQEQEFCFQFAPEETSADACMAAWIKRRVCLKPPSAAPAPPAPTADVAPPTPPADVTPAEPPTPPADVTPAEPPTPPADVTPAEPPTPPEDVAPQE